MRRLLLALLLAAPTLVSAETIYRDYATATTVLVDLWETDGTDLKTDATFATGDCKIMVDEGAEANCANLPTDEGQSYSLALSAGETTGKRIKVLLVDSATKAWLDRTITIETSGNAASQHPVTSVTSSTYRSQTR